jgi:hypothetical protein
LEDGEGDAMMRESRRAVVLFVTLSIIAAMLALVGAIYSYLDRSRSDASHTSALIQADLLLRDGRNAIEGLIKKGSSDKKLKETILDTLYLAPLTLQSEENEDMFTTLQCSPADNGIDINWLGLENNASAQLKYNLAQTVYDRLAEMHNIQNPARLLSMLMHAVRGEKDPENGNEYRMNQKKGIISESQMQELVREYAFQEGDSSVEEIRWKDYFTYDIGQEKIDGRYFSPELVSLLFGIDIDAAKEEWSPGSDLKAFVGEQGGSLSEYDEKLFSKDPIERMSCRISYGFREKVYAMGFKYMEGKAEKFEFFGEQ